MWLVTICLSYTILLPRMLPEMHNENQLKRLTVVVKDSQKQIIKKIKQKHN